jgi:tetratricopeptide (TPR) repeat protein
MYYEQALAIHLEIGDRCGEGRSLNNLGLVRRDQGHYSEAQTYCEQALAIFREIGGRREEGNVLISLGASHRDLGDFTRAEACFMEALRISHELGSRASESEALSCLGLLLHLLGDDERARVVGLQALAIATELGDQTREALALTSLGYVWIALRNNAEAAEAFQRALQLRQRLGQPHLAMEPLAGLARLAMTQDDLAQAKEHVEGILAHLKIGSLEGTVEPFLVYLTCYRVLQASGDLRATELLTTAHSRLQEQMEAIEEPELRRLFLESAPARREIVAEVGRLV